MKCKVLGLNLMYLLVENRLSEFHAELELLSEVEASAPFVSFPINLERQLMVGSYDEVLKAGLHIPDQSYQFFMDNLLQTVRDSIADCLEVSHKTMGIGDAVKAIDSPVVEVHISNTFSREEFRHKSYISAGAKGVILGFGLESYSLAIESFLST